MKHHGSLFFKRCFLLLTLSNSLPGEDKRENEVYSSSEGEVITSQ